MQVEQPARRVSSDRECVQLADPPPAMLAGTAITTIKVNNRTSNSKRQIATTSNRVLSVAVVNQA